MAIDFPSAPTNGQVFTDTTSGQSWTWDGTKWVGSSGTAYWNRTGTTVSPATAGDTISTTGTVTGNLLPTNGPMSGFRNLLINPGFSINQRGAANRWLGQGVYGFDRWRGAANGDPNYVEQIIEDAPAGRYTLSVHGGTIAGRQLSAHYANISQIAIGAVGERTLTFDFDGTTGRLAVFVPVDADSAQVEIGEVATPHERRPIGTELVLCQRYYQQYSISEGGNAHAAGITEARWLPFPTVMRVGPISSATPTTNVNVTSYNQDLIKTNGTRRLYAIAGAGPWRFDSTETFTAEL